MQKVAHCREQVMIVVSIKVYKDMAGWLKQCILACI